jgi:hypothetical protein
VLVAALEEFALDQEGRLRPGVADGEAIDLGAAGELGDLQLGVGAGAEAELAPSVRPDREDRERAELPADADVELGELHGASSGPKHLR